ncbi:hypothetical protein [Actinomycetospora sp.]|uniref:hypothetical protein n=1 Tax=Actinomycetospora sp. TaxID=1872135 RepID=UPI002F3F8D63
MVTTHPARTGATSWTPAELGVLLQAVEPVPDPAPPAGSVTVHDRVVDVVPLAGAPDGTPGHADLVAVGRLVAGLEIAVRSLGWEPERDTADDARADPLVRLTATRRRPAIPAALAMHRVDRRLREGRLVGTGSPDAAQVVDVARGGSTTRAWCVLANGPSQGGAPSWHSPGTPVPEAASIRLPWTRDPVLAVCTHDDEPADHVAAGIAAHRAVVTAGLRGLLAAVHTAGVAEPADRVAWGHRVDPGHGRVQALVHLHT